MTSYFAQKTLLAFPLRLKRENYELFSMKSKNPFNIANIINHLEISG